jgi:hypothetical protein
MPCVYVTQGRGVRALSHDRPHRSASDVSRDHDHFGYYCGFQRGVTANAVARATAHSGWDGLGDGGAHGIAPTLARKQQPSERRYDPWGHWGGYYGPMIAHP